MTLKMDSKAAIGAVSKGTLSERRRVRAAGRAWLNFCRADFLMKQDDINIEHVFSHKGTETAEQRGNDAADRIAKGHRRMGEGKQCHYFTDSEEQFVLQQMELNVQGNPRLFLKSMEQKQMFDLWKKRSATEQLFPTQILKQSKSVWMVNRARQR